MWVRYLRVVRVYLSINVSWLRIWDIYCCCFSKYCNVGVSGCKCYVFSINLVGKFYVF